MTELWNVLADHFSEFSTGFWVTVRIVVISFVIAMVVGTLVATMRIAPVKLLNWVGGVFVEVFRNTPLLVLLFISYAGLRRAGLPISAWVAGVGSLGLYTSAYVAEALRSGVFAVGKGQIDASLSLGLDYPRTLRYVILPQAVRTVIPHLGSLTIAMIKNSAIIGVSLLALEDLLHQARLVNSRTFQTDEVFFWAAVGYLILTLLTTLAVRRLEVRYAIHR
ncbi:MAG TPA: amino acid ABC transporter permease [Thermoleophilaceae bacterium]|nr:amino acid ABC transporter permease [Thermoleophilaceae bacterium]